MAAPGELNGEFRTETRAWLADNCPPSMRTPMRPGEEINGGTKRVSPNPEAYVWLERMAERGWTVVSMRDDWARIYRPR